MGQPSNARYLDGARRSIRDPHSMPNVERLVQALRRQPGITEISLADVFTPGDFFTLSEYRRRGESGPLAWTHRIPEVIRTAKAQGLIHCIPTSHPKLTACYAVETTDPEYGTAVAA